MIKYLKDLFAYLFHYKHLKEPYSEDFMISPETSRAIGKLSGLGYTAKEVAEALKRMAS